MTPVSLTWVRRKARWLPRRWPSSSEPPWSLTNRTFVAGLTCQPSRSPAPRASGSPTKGAVICSWGASRQPLLRGVLCDGSAWLHGLFALFQRTADGHETWTLTCYCSRTANCPARHQSPRVAHGSSRNKAHGDKNWQAPARCNAFAKEESGVEKKSGDELQEEGFYGEVLLIASALCASTPMGYWSQRRRRGRRRRGRRGRGRRGG